MKASTDTAVTWMTHSVVRLVVTAAGGFKPPEPVPGFK